MADAPLPVGLELGKKRVFAWAQDWPGWCRAGKTEADALAALAAYGPRYAPVAAEAGFELEARIVIVPDSAMHIHLGRTHPGPLSAAAPAEKRTRTARR